MMQKLILVLAAVFLNACAVMTPVHEAESPEVLGNWGFKFGYLVGTSNVVGTERVLSSGQDLIYEDALIGSRIAFGFLDHFQLTFDAFGGPGSTGSSAALKWQFKGNNYFEAKAGDVAMSFILRSWNGNTLDYDPNISGDIYAESDIEGKGLDFTYLVGYRMLDWLGVYIGPKYITGSVTEKYKSVDNGPVVYEASRDVTLYGAIAGLHMSPHSKHFAFDVSMEIQYINTPATYSNVRTWQQNRAIGISIPFSFN